jgi:transposase-like protein
MLNILDKVPQHAQPEMKEDLREIYYSRSKTKSEELIKLFKEKYRAKYPKAVESLQEAEDRLLNYFSYPKGHWKSIKTTNPIESIFATVKLRIRLRRTARRIKTRQSAVYLIFKVLTESQKRWRRINNWKSVRIELEKLSSKTYVTALVDEVST